MFRNMVISCVCLVLFQSAVARAAAPTFQMLMDPGVFPDAQYGMQVERAAVEGESARITTTGAELSIAASGDALFCQRIGHPREIVTMSIEGGLKAAPDLTHNTQGLAFLQWASPRLDLRANGDSLFMFHFHEPTTITLKRHIGVGFNSMSHSNGLILDEWGGFGLYSSDPEFGAAVNAFATPIVRYTMPADAVLWIGICPPKPYDWDRSLRDNVVWHWSDKTGYPADTDFARWAKEGNIALLQSEVMLWKDWNLAFVPRLGEAEFARVKKTAHDLGMRFIVYTSPYYFLKDTPIESKAMNTFENFKGFPPGWPDGVNIDLFMDEITHVMKDYGPDGLYFDGQYTASAPALYALARRTRALLGDTGILEWHSTLALSGGLCYLPQADAYVDFILRGEGEERNYKDFDYLRYFVSGYNVSNSIGVLCNNNSAPTPEIVDRVLEVNARLHTIAGWLDNPQLVDVVHNNYKARLTPALREQVDQGVDKRQAEIGRRTEALERESRELASPPQWKDPVLAEAFDAIPAWTRHVSPLDTDDPFKIQDGALAISAKAHTYAFFAKELSSKVTGFTVRLRQGTDGGMSWGPAVCLKWEGGPFLRVGLRSDSKLQCDINGDQRLFGAHTPDQWVTLRVRWGAYFCVIETAAADGNYACIHSFCHNGSLSGAVKQVAVGKVSYSGELLDNPEPGTIGVCNVDDLRVY